LDLLPLLRGGEGRGEVGDAPMTNERNMIAETAARLFAAHLDTAVIEAAEAGTWPAALWDEIAANGLDRVLVPEEKGGIGGSWEDAFVILRAAGRHAAPVPLAETIGAGYLLAQAGLDAPEGPLSLAEDVSRVPWAAQAVQVLVGDGENKFGVFSLAGAEITPDRNLGRDPRAGMAGTAEATGDGDVMAIGALVRACQMSGAISQVLELCITYAGERVQFGRPIGKFQAIQQQLAILAGEAAAADIAAQVACRALDRSGDALFEIATAKIRAGEAAGKAAAISHQVFGAIGFTDEHHLHHLTRRLWSWRAEFGAESIWAKGLGRLVVEQGADSLWPNLTKTI